MKPQTDRKKMTSKKPMYIGQRMKEIRNELKLTQEFIVMECGAENQTTISNLENKGMTGDFLWVYLEYLYKQGYNPAWIVIEDNSAISKKIDKTTGTRYYKHQIDRIREIAIANSETNKELQDIVATLDDLAPVKS